uniref:Uncharacterized protein n=1 Tax=Arundo donax TaxID=35708 RepID=A0A0A9ADK7_ARUDO
MLSSNRRNSKKPFALPILSLHIVDPAASLVCAVVVFEPPDLVTLLSSLLHDRYRLALAQLKCRANYDSIRSKILVFSNNSESRKQRPSA